MRFYWNMIRLDDGSLGSCTEVAHPLVNGPGRYDENELRLLTEAFDEITPGVIIPAEYTPGKKAFEDVSAAVMNRFTELKKISQ